MSKFNNINNKKVSALSLLMIASGFTTTAYAAIVTKANTVIKADHYLLSNNLYNDGSDMSYDPAQVDVLGAAFSINYVDAGGSGMDAYVQGTVGGAKSGGAWRPGDYSLTGMPVQIQSLDNNFRLKWKTFQNSDAHDADDKWWATINVIFDAGTDVSEPIAADRDYDVVIQMERYEQDTLTDKEKANNNSYWWFARNPDSSIKPLVLNVDGIDYEWAVRYKFFQNSGDDNNKVHIKFIPVDNSNTPPYIDHPLKTFVDATVDYLQYIDIPSAELSLANEKVADPNLWVKSVRAGYEVYTGQFTVGNEYFKTVIDLTAPDTPENLSAIENSDHIAVNWDEVNDLALQNYILYRSVNGGNFTPVAADLYNGSYNDSDVLTGNNYDYYVTAQDRSFNESPASTIVNQSFGGVSNNAPVWNNPDFSQPDIIENVSYVKYLASRVTDAESDPLTFNKVSGPTWLTINANGKIEGTPLNSDVGTNVFVVSVTDGFNSPVNATMTIEVLADTASNSAPVFNSDPIVSASAQKNQAYNQSIAGEVNDADGDTLTFSLVSGPSWLNVSSTGQLTGTPRKKQVGINSFVVSVTDGINSAVQASLTIDVSN
ncbi:putative Ig domain-containing protein [Thalassomonas sp. M1454]|uniref:putative Ig domain-containing protein n=1 Tax=Thalassomonas sp. M1454 TaxID=2594477 RepID=UPI00117EA5C0|nr:putative Ig domain-containing protein [Thalassomonas sp. M1454]TRX53924.1 hypothetical protein FNN08_13290 [Thalassomonas sp. M1454]